MNVLAKKWYKSTQQGISVETLADVNDVSRFEIINAISEYKGSLNAEPNLETAELQFVVEIKNGEEEITILNDFKKAGWNWLFERDSKTRKLNPSYPVYYLLEPKFSWYHYDFIRANKNYKKVPLLEGRGIIQKLSPVDLEIQAEPQKQALEKEEPINTDSKRIEVQLSNENFDLLEFLGTYAGISTSEIINRAVNSLKSEFRAILK